MPPIVTPESDAAIRAFLAQKAGAVPGAPLIPVAPPAPVAPVQVAAGTDSLLASQLGHPPTQADLGLEAWKQKMVSGGLLAPRPETAPAQLSPADAKKASEAAKQAEVNAQAAAFQRQFSSIGSPKTPVNPEPVPATPAPGQVAPTIAAPAPTVIPAGWDPKRNPFRRDTLDAIDKAGAEQRASMERSGQNEAGAAIQRAEMIAQNAQKLADVDATVKTAEAVRADKYAAKEREIDQAQNEAFRLSQIDPERRFGKASTGTKVSMIVGSALGGMLQGLQGGGKNEFMESVYKLIDEDIDAQKTLAGAANQRVANMRGQLGFMREKFGDERAAEAGNRMAMLDQFRLEAEKLAQSNQSVQVQENARMAISQLDEAKALERGKLRDLQEFRPAQVVGGVGGAPMKQEEQALIVRTPDGRQIRARTEKEAQALRSAIPAVAKMKRLAQEIDSKRTPGGLLSPENRAELDTLGTEYVLAMKEASNAGALDKGLVDVAQTALGDPTGVFSFAGKKGLKYADLAERGLGEQIRAQSGEQVATSYTRDKTGALAPTATYQGQQVRTQAMPTSFKPRGQ